MRKAASRCRKFSNSASSTGSLIYTKADGILRDGNYRYGVAEKLLNLALKYYWCLGHIPTPPHCPVDRIVIEKTHLRGRVNWTEIKDEPQYRGVIEANQKSCRK